MTHDPVPSQETLAQQAASWVPPWQREQEPDADADPADPADAAPPADPADPADPDAAADPDDPADPDAAAAADPSGQITVMTPDSGSDDGHIPDLANEAEADEVEVEAEVDEDEVEVEAEADEDEVEAEAVEAEVEVAEADEVEVAEAAEAVVPDFEPFVAEAVLEAVAVPVAALSAQAVAPRQEAAPPQEAAGAGDDASELVAMDPQELNAALEAILMVVDEPVGEIMLAQVLEQPVDVIAFALRDLARAYTQEGRGFDLRQAAGGWRFYTRENYASYVERFVLDGQSVRLTQAALETLAVVAYKQPVTRSRISAIRGVNCDGVVRTLMSRGLIEECGAEPDSGAHLYRTTGLFLEKLGLDSVDELPALAPFLPDNVEEIADADR